MRKTNVRVVAMIQSTVALLYVVCRSRFVSHCVTAVYVYARVACFIEQNHKA